MLIIFFSFSPIIRKRATLHARENRRACFPLPTPGRRGGLAYGGDQEGGGWADGWGGGGGGGGGGRRGGGGGREREGGASVSLARCVSSFLMYG